MPVGAIIIPTSSTDTKEVSSHIIEYYIHMIRWIFWYWGVGAGVISDPTNAIEDFLTYWGFYSAKLESVKKNINVYLLPNICKIFF